MKTSQKQRVLDAVSSLFKKNENLRWPDKFDFETNRQTASND